MQINTCAVKGNAVWQHWEPACRAPKASSAVRPFLREAVSVCRVSDLFSTELWVKCSAPTFTKGVSASWVNYIVFAIATPKWLKKEHIIPRNCNFLVGLDKLIIRLNTKSEADNIFIDISSQLLTKRVQSSQSCSIFEHFYPLPKFRILRVSVLISYLWIPRVHGMMFGKQ